MLLWTLLLGNSHNDFFAFLSNSRKGAMLEITGKSLWAAIASVFKESTSFHDTQKNWHLDYKEAIS